MTNFNKSTFDMGYGSDRYLTYEGKFIARFKHANAASCSRYFVRFLIANFTVEEYFDLREQPHPIAKGVKLAPSEVLATKGFIDFNTRKAMKRGGYATVKEMLDAQMAAFHARQAA
jgi:hypothetical protein